MLRQANNATIRFDQLNGWTEDDLKAALGVLGKTKEPLGSITDPSDFFEKNYTPIEITKHGATHFTGYYEPELRGARAQSTEFSVPIYAQPPRRDQLELSRSDIMRGALNGQGLEICWLRSASDAFFLQVQGSGRISFDGGQKIRVGYAGKNHHAYQSIGQIAVKQGLFERTTITADGLKHWIDSNPVEGFALMEANPSFVFFKILDHPVTEGPIGTAGFPLTPFRSIAVDPAFIPLGTPVWVEVNDIKALMIASDTGSAIKGAGRADIFFGTGPQAGLAAGKTNCSGRLVVLKPKAM